MTKPIYSVKIDTENSTIEITLKGNRMIISALLNGWLKSCKLQANNMGWLSPETNGDSTSVVPYTTKWAFFSIYIKVKVLIHQLAYTLIS